MPIAAGGFIYIAVADLIPELHKTRNIKHSIIQLCIIMAGVIAMLALLFLE
jgi:zinc transporter ZupT